MYKTHQAEPQENRKPSPEYGRVLMIGRFKPLHLGGARMLDGVLKRAKHGVICIGSVNKYNERNPFTADETEEMMRSYLAPRYSNFSFIRVPDYAHIPEYADGKKWVQTIRDLCGQVDLVVSGNAYVRDLLSPFYKTMHSAEFIPPESQIPVSSTDVRVAMAGYGDWQSLVPKEIASYITTNHLDDRFRNEFGLETLAKLYTEQVSQELDLQNVTPEHMSLDERALEKARTTEV
jgi:nicotinamide-nucleotide adenylyltransferase